MLPDHLSDICISFASVPLHINGATARGTLWQAAPGRFLLEAPGVARYLVEQGRQVAIASFPQAEKVEILRFLRMTPLAALLFQRGIFAFHAAAVVGPYGAILVAGDSGAGKSTLLAAMLKRGWKLLSDDLAVVKSDENGTPMAFPTFPELSLWPDAMEKFGIPGRDGGRHYLSKDDCFAASPHPLRAIYRLSVHKEEISLCDIRGLKTFSALSSLLYNRYIADALLDRTALMRQGTCIAEKVPMRALRRPRGRWCVEQLADIVERGCR